MANNGWSGTTKSSYRQEARRKETYKYLGMLEADTIKQKEIKEIIKKEYLRRVSKLLETKLYSRNIFKGMNIWAAHLVRYLRPFLKWTREFKQMDQRTRKLITNHKAFYPRDVRWQTIGIKKRGRKRTRQNWRQRGYIDITTRRQYRKAQRKSEYNHQKQY